MDRVISGLRQQIRLSRLPILTGQQTTVSDYSYNYNNGLYLFLSWFLPISLGIATTRVDSIAYYYYIQ